jgi:hypothetical protein
MLFATRPRGSDLLEADGLPPTVEDGGLPLLIGWPDNGWEMTALDTRKCTALMAITQHTARDPADQAHIESVTPISRARTVRLGTSPPTSWDSAVPPGVWRLLRLAKEQRGHCSALRGFPARAGAEADCCHGD